MLYHGPVPPRFPSASDLGAMSRSSPSATEETHDSSDLDWNYDFEPVRELPRRPPRVHHTPSPSALESAQVRRLPVTYWDTTTDSEGETASSLTAIRAPLAVSVSLRFRGCWE